MGRNDSEPAAPILTLGQVTNKTWVGGLRPAETGEGFLGGSGRDRTELRHVPALDGIRAFAVVAIIATHTPGTGFSGGYFSVDSFFALSGYLITSLLLKEWRNKGTISLRGFWARRARRLLPALFVLLVALGVGAALWPAILSTPGLRGDALSTIFYFANWHLIAQHSNYFAALSQSPLQHTWTLSIEEQFYLLWPLVVLAILRVGRRPSSNLFVDFAGDGRSRRRLKLLLGLAVCGAVASAVWMGAITNNLEDTARSYFGSDTRAQSLLVGAALAVVFSLWRPSDSPRTRRVLSFLGVAGATTTFALWFSVREASWFAYRGGFLLASVSTVCVIASVVHRPRTVVARVLSLRPVGYVGRISYGMYLWYWPFVLVLTPDRTHLSGYGLLVVRLCAIVAVASVSAYLVEIPIRTGRFPSRRWTAVAIPVGAAASIVSIFLATLAPTAALGLSNVPAVTASQGGGSGTGSQLVSESSPPPSPLKVLLIGDSMAGTLGVGLSEVAAKYGVVVANEGIAGCSLSMDKEILSLMLTAPPSPPCDPANQQALLDTWKGWVDSWNPDVVLYFARGEILNQHIGSSSAWVHIGMPAFDARFSARLEEALTILGSRGAHVYLLGSPLYHSGLQDEISSPWPEDSPQRVAIDDALMKQAVSRSSGASFVDVGSWLSPGGKYTSEVDGVQARCSDGVHMTPAGGAWVAEKLLPLIVQSARTHHDESPGGRWRGKFPAQVPSWYSSVPC